MKVEERNRKGYYVEVKKDTLYYYGMNGLIGSYCDIGAMLCGLYVLSGE